MHTKYQPFVQEFDGLATFEYSSQKPLRKTGRVFIPR